jgi:hypothetical protein
MSDTLLDGWTDALGKVLADERREWQRERGLAIAEIRAEAASLMLALKDKLDAPAPEPAAPQYVSDELALMVAKAAALLAEASPIITQPAPPQPPAVVNVTVPLPAPRTERTRVTKHDEQGRIVEIERDVA